MAGQGGLGGGFLAIGKSMAKVYVETDTKVTFDDVAGVDEAKEELQEVVGFLKDPKRYTRQGGHIPKGVCWSARRATRRGCAHHESRYARGGRAAVTAEGDNERDRNRRSRRGAEARGAEARGLTGDPAWTGYHK